MSNKTYIDKTINNIGKDFKEHQYTKNKQANKPKTSNYLGDYDWQRFSTSLPSKIKPNMYEHSFIHSEKTSVESWLWMARQYTNFGLVDQVAK